MTNTILGLNGDDSIYGKELADNLYGGSGDDYLKGDYGDDYLFGGAGQDDLRGFEDDDVLNGGAGEDDLRGGTGADNFLFYGDDAFVFDPNDAVTDIDRIIDFSVSEGDTISLVDLLFGYDPVSDDINDFITLTETTHTSINVDRDGQGTDYTAQQIIRVENITGQWLDVDDMISQGHLSVA